MKSVILGQSNHKKTSQNPGGTEQWTLTSPTLNENGDNVQDLTIFL